MIRKRHYPELDLIVHTVSGEMDLEEFRAAGFALYEMDPVPRLSLWHFGDASLKSFTIDRIRSVQEELEGKVRGREGGRTAVVVPGDFDFAVARQYMAYAEDLDLPFQQATFRDLDDALRWLGLDRSDLDPDPA